MASVGDVMHRLLPRGTWAAEGVSDWSTVPWWPPDVFAVAATLARLSDCHAHPAVRGGDGLGDHVETSARFGKQWAEFSASRELTRALQKHWDVLRSASAAPVMLDVGKPLPAWARAALSLLAIADEASAGVGFRGSSAVAVQAEQVALDRRLTTLTIAVDPSEACVQPKARTPAVGCNLRSVSHHLALLPPWSQVDTRHWSMPRLFSGTQLGLLLVPFPYVVGANDFGGRLVKRHTWGRLRVNPSWLNRAKPAAFAGFVRGLIDAASSRGRETDIVLVPEAALSPRHFDALAVVLERLKRPLLLVAGVGAPAGGVVRNFVRVAALGMGRALGWEQDKHHRWKVEKWQIQNYGLGLDPGASWWEDLDVSRRRVVITQFHQRASIAALICEDLARVEPVQPVVRELGPNLVLALLMDGPQRAGRWPGQYAGVLAEDPGSSVLSATSLGLVRRYREFREKGRGDSHAIVGLWKDRTGQAQELGLGPAQHALHLSLKLSSRTEFTLDGRADAGAARVVTLKSVEQVQHANPPEWAQPFYSA